jgi:hypothetical protein
MLLYFGGIGAGLVWGWLAILVLGRGAPRRALVDFLWLAGVTLLLCLQHLFVADWTAAACFLGATGAAAVLHLGWLASLRRAP